MSQRLTTASWSVLDFSRDELQAATVEELRQLSWAEAGVAAIETSRLGIRLRFSGYAGRISLPGELIIDISELLPGTVATLAPLAAGGRRWREEWQTRGSASIPPWVALAESFARDVYAYVGAGIERRYLPRRWLTSRPRGHINAAATARAWAEGRRPLLACDVRPLTDDTPLNRYILSAAVRAETILRSYGQEGERAFQLRAALNALTGVTYERLPDYRSAWEATEPGDDFLQRLLGLARLFVMSVAAMANESLERQPVDVWFNVPLVFEQAVRRLVAERVGASGRVRAGKGDGTQLLDTSAGDGGTLDADPDIVIRAHGRTAIMDAKYRNTGANVSREQLYQLIAHAVAYEAEWAALVVPRLVAGPRLQLLGTDSAGRRYYIIAVDAADLDDVEGGLSDWLEATILALAPAYAVAAS
jgi:hypothetical protein